MRNYKIFKCDWKQESLEEDTGEVRISQQYRRDELRIEAFQKRWSYGKKPNLEKETSAIVILSPKKAIRFAKAILKFYNK